jgi:hypothetical protein
MTPGPNLRMFLPCDVGEGLESLSDESSVFYLIIMMLEIMTKTELY